MKNLFILGDSYSTFEGYIPEGYAIYYPNVEFTGVSDVNQCWWKILCDEEEYTLVRNDSWSGTTICNTGYGPCDATEFSFIGRINRLEKEGFFKNNEIDTVMVFGGTNDDWSNNTLGELIFENQTKEDLYNVLPAIPFLLKRVKEVMPKARLICIVNSDLREGVTNGLLESAKYYGYEIVKLHDIEKGEGHPTIKGMRAIKDQIAEIL